MLFWVQPSPGGSDNKESACNAGDSGPRSGKIPWKRKWQTHFSILAWKILWTEEPGGLQCVGSQRVRRNWAIQYCRVAQGILTLSCSILYGTWIIPSSSMSTLYVSYLPVKRKKQSILGSVLCAVSGIRWGSWNVFPADKGKLLWPQLTWVL